MSPRLPHPLIPSFLVIIFYSLCLHETSELTFTRVKVRSVPSQQSPPTDGTQRVDLPSRMDERDVVKRSTTRPGVLLVLPSFNGTEGTPVVTCLTYPNHPLSDTRELTIMTPGTGHRLFREAHVVNKRQFLNVYFILFLHQTTYGKR